MKVSSSIKYCMYEYSVPTDSVNNAIRFEMYFRIIAYVNSFKFWRNMATFRKFFKTKTVLF